MNGKDLLEGISFIDDAYVDEAAKMTSWPWRRWVCVAACVCVLLAGTLGWFVRKHADPGPGPGILGNPTNPTFDNPSIAGTVATQEAPSVKVRIDRWNENGFEATVTELVDSTDFEVGMRLTVVFSDGAIVHGQWVAPAQEMLPVGTVVKVQLRSASGSFDRENSIIYISLIHMSEEEGT